MLAGMYVVRDETPTLVVALNGTASGSTVHRSTTTYTMRPLGWDAVTYLRDPLATQVPLLPACETGCGARAGHPCFGQHGRTEHDRAWSDEMFARAKGVPNE